MKMEKKFDLCMRKGCASKAGQRGLCSRCYQTYRRSVLNGQVTWEQLEEYGLVLQKKRFGPNDVKKYPELHEAIEYYKHQVTKSVSTEPLTKQDVKSIDQSVTQEEHMKDIVNPVTEEETFHIIEENLYSSGQQAEPIPIVESVPEPAPALPEPEPIVPEVAVRQHVKAPWER